MKREYPVAPIVAVGAVILDGDRILLLRRDREPARERWTFPGGAVELGESQGRAPLETARQDQVGDHKSPYEGRLSRFVQNLSPDAIIFPGPDTFRWNLPNLFIWHLQYHFTS